MIFVYYNNYDIYLQRIRYIMYHKHNDMTTATTTDAKIFLTDYASYNNGTQFEFGHWLELDQFSDADELMDYIKEHFEECDEKSPLDSPREEIMITDFEGFPSELYSESMGKNEFEKVFQLFEYMEDNNIDSLKNEGENLLELWNEYCRENASGDDEIYHFDDDTLSMLFGEDSMRAFQSGVNSQINWSDDYIYLNGYGNIISTDDPSTQIDETLIISWILENL